MRRRAPVVKKAESTLAFREHWPETICIMRASLEHRMRDRIEHAWALSWTHFFRPETNLFYDYLSSRSPDTCQAHLPTAEEIKRQYPNTCGWGTGMEDSAISAGLWMSTICTRMETLVVPDNDYSFCREDGRPDVLGRMWGNIKSHEWARLPMIYLVGWDLTADGHWRDLYGRHAWQAARASLTSPIWKRVAYAYLQAVFSLEPLVALEQQDPNLQAAWMKALHFYANRMEGFTWTALRYKPADPDSVEMDWRKRTMQPHANGDCPAWPPAALEEMKTVREPGEAILAQLLVPGRPLTDDQMDLFQHMLSCTRFDNCLLYSLFYPIAAYWRATKLGLLLYRRRGSVRLPSPPKTWNNWGKSINSQA